MLCQQKPSQIPPAASFSVCARHCCRESFAHNLQRPLQRHPFQPKLGSSLVDVGIGSPGLVTIQARLFRRLPSQMKPVGCLGWRWLLQCLFPSANNHRLIKYETQNTILCELFNNEAGSRLTPCTGPRPACPGPTAAPGGKASATASRGLRSILPVASRSKWSAASVMTYGSVPGLLDFMGASSQIKTHSIAWQVTQDLSQLCPLLAVLFISGAIFSEDCQWLLMCALAKFDQYIKGVDSLGSSYDKHFGFIRVF